MKKHIKYISYLIRHKVYVLIECFKVGLYWEGIWHDWSKFLPSEWFPYANYFYKRPKIDTARGYYKPTDTGDDAFDFAWMLHQKRNNHHWQWWILGEDEGGLKVLPMSEKARLEMVCDWIGASRAQGRGGFEAVRGWYVEHKHKMQFHKETREWVEKYLNV